MSVRNLRDKIRNYRPATADNTGFAAHFVRQNASHFAKPENVRRNWLWQLNSRGDSNGKKEKH